MKTKDEKDNSFMIRNMKELKKHSKIMEHMMTETDIKKIDKVPDPIQHGRKEK
ncbi:hypothetical protein ACFSCX_17555 [Bacillus salitolerans]|uniref:Multidrug ABC transporter ATPase n=1 Tax=Bacillus salitolerans TaxID=1437434 RepID=A0ABW4LTD0_9BACI